MSKRIVDLRENKPLLDIASYGRRGPGDQRFSKAEVGHISRTVRKVPEVMIKVSAGARTLQGVEEHLDYIGREGEGGWRLMTVGICERGVSRERY